jgi:hypothetical protein
LLEMDMKTKKDGQLLDTIVSCGNMLSRLKYKQKLCVSDPHLKLRTCTICLYLCSE